MDNEQISSVSQEPLVESALPPVQSVSSLPSATTTLKQAWAIYKQRLGTFLGVMIIPTLVMIISSTIVSGSGLLVKSGGISLFLPIILLGVVLFLATFLSQTWGQIALLYAIKGSQEKIGVKESYRLGWHKILSYWWVSLLSGIITVGGFLLLIVPGIIFAIWFSMALFILIAEDLKGMNAILKSKEYVKGKTGAVLWRGIFIGVISILVCLVPIIILTLWKVPYVSEIFGFAVALFLSPLVTTYSFLVYTNLKNLKGANTLTPTGGKAKFIILGILGFLLIPIIISVIVFSTLGPAKQKAHNMKRYTDISTIQWGINAYYSENGTYPSSLNELSPKYLPVMPVDPKTNQPYQYQLQLDQLGYKVCAQLEATKTQKCVSSNPDYLDIQ